MCTSLFGATTTGAVLKDDSEVEGGALLPLQLVSAVQKMGPTRSEI